MVLLEKSFSVVLDIFRKLWRLVEEARGVEVVDKAGRIGKPAESVVVDDHDTVRMIR